MLSGRMMESGLWIQNNILSAVWKVNEVEGGGTEKGYLRQEEERPSGRPLQGFTLETMRTWFEEQTVEKEGWRDSRELPTHQSQ